MPDQDDRIETLFQRAVDLPPDERGRFLDAHAADDPELRASVESLLAHFEASRGLTLESPLAGLAGGLTVPANLLPSCIGPYPILAELGRGGMGVVYRARDSQLERDIALKVLPDTLASDPDRTARLRQEARLLASVNHPAIATVYALDEAGGQTFIAMELVSGVSLAETLKHGAMDPRDGLRVSQQIAAALEAAHQKGVVHRDLKPANVMVSDDGTVKVLDFGLATSTMKGADVETDGIIAGTPGFMSPEQIRGDAPDVRTDIFALGCLMYQCLTGSAAFQGETATEIMRATLEVQPAWERLDKAAPSTVGDLIRASLAKPVDDRLDSILPLRRAINEQLALLTRPQRPEAGGLRRFGVPNNLLAPLSTFVGRDHERVALSTHLAEHRVVTLTGSGGAGKSRLALEVARQNLSGFPGGVWLVELAPLSAGGSIDVAVADAIGLTETRGVSRLDAIVDRLEGERALLVLDNCEHLIDHAATFVQSLVERLETLVVLATSRERLGIVGELAFSVSGMGDHAVELFVQRACAVRQDFALTDDNRDAIRSICEELDAIPLAIELAAARMKLLTARQIADRLDDRFRLLGGGRRSGLPHHRTLRSLIDWSYEQLEPGEQRLLTRLSVFAGGWSLEAAEEVCAGEGIETWEVLDLLTVLLDKSLIEVEPWERDANRVRYRMLETVRAYAGEHLEDRPATEARHREFFGQMAREGRDAISGPEGVDWVNRLETDFGNLSMAIDTGAAMRPIAPETLPIIVTLMGLTHMQGRPTLSQSFGERALALPGVRESRDENVGHVYHRLGNAANGRGDLDAAVEFFDIAYVIWQELDHQRNMAGVLNNKGLIANERGEHESATELFLRALEINRSIGNKDWESSNLNNLGMVSNLAGHTEESRRYYQQAVDLAREVGNRYYLAIFLDNLAVTVAFMDELDRALALHREALELHRELGTRRGEAAVLVNMASIMRTKGEIGRAHRYLCQSLGIRREFDDSLHRALIGIEALAEILEMSGKPAVAVRLCSRVSAYRSERGVTAGRFQDATVQKLMHRARGALGDARFEQEVEAGQTLTLEDAIELALSTEGPGTSLDTG